MKKLSVKIGEYQKDGQTKGRYVNLGVIMSSSDGGEYALIDPSVSLAGVLQQQNVLAASQGKEQRDRIMVGVFDDSQQGGYQQPQQQQQAPQQQRQAPQQQQPQQTNDFDSDIPF